MNRLTEILRDSSLATTMSDMEIDEISQEIRADFEDLIEEEKEKIREEVTNELRNDEKDKEINSLNKTVSRLEDKIQELKDRSVNCETLRDVMAMEWVKENWEWICKMENSGRTAESIFTNSMIDGNVLAEKALETILLHEIDKTMNHKRIILVGKAASGKDHARKILESRGYKYAVSYTTRPPRSNETDGEDYFFLSEEEFEKMAKNEDFYEHISFNTWRYGTSKAQFYSDDVFIMTPYGISKVHPDDRKRSLIILFDMDPEIRKARLMERSDADSVERRLAADEADFENFTDFDIKITNHNF
jgi:guanylate kinase